MAKKAFTLAEVLITLGIIGIIAALTIPGLIASYQKKVLETRIKKFYSVINQAVNTNIAESGRMDETMLSAAFDPNVMEEFFNVNYKPYLRTVKAEKLTKGFAVAFADGSGMYLVKTSAEGANLNTAGCTYIIWCVDYKKCEDVDKMVTTGVETDGKNSFLFWTGGHTELAHERNQDRAKLLTACGGTDKNLCSALLMYDGWEIRDDYPW